MINNWRTFQNAETMSNSADVQWRLQNTYCKCIGKSLKVIKLVLFYIFESVQLTLTEYQISDNESFSTLS